MDVSVLPSKLLSDLSSAVDIVRRHPFIHVYSHFDADGLTSAAIIMKTLIREGKEFDVTIFPTLEDSQMQIIEQTGGECVLVTDLGASFIKRFDEMECDVVVLDHHKVVDLPKRICYSNPHLYGIDGGNGGCGASMALLFAVTMNDSNWDMSPIAMAGIAGDMQHKTGLKGLNVPICEEAVKRGYVKELPGSLIPVGNLSSELFLSTDPFIVGVSGDSIGTSKFLEEAKIAPGKEFSTLTSEEAIRLSSLIAIKLIDHGVPRDIMEECTRPIFQLPDWGTDAETLASVINACGRKEVPSLGIAVALGDANALNEAKRLDAELRKEIIESVMNVVNSNKVHEMKNIQWVDSSKTGNTGLLCSVVMNYIGNPNKPTIVINSADSKSKVSSRGTTVLVQKKLDLSDVMRKACAAAGGSGGGHNIASGGSFESDRINEFLEAADFIVGEQLK